MDGESRSRFAPAVVVYEREPRFEPDLKRLLASRELLVRPCRSTNDVIALCGRMPGSVLVIDLEVSAAEVLRLLERLTLGRLGARPVVVAGPGFGSLEWAFREAGAVDVVPTTIPSGELARQCLRLLGE